MQNTQRHRLYSIVIPLILLTTFFSINDFAQPFKRMIDGIPVTIGGVVVSQPFAGGVNSPNYQFVDIDDDDDLDLFIYDNDLFVDFYRNTGSVTLAKFMLEPHQIELPKFQTWFLFCDLNGDGKIDFLTDDFGSGVRYSINEGTSQNPIFVIHDSTMMDTAGFSIFAGFSSIPALVDIDADGDVDFFSNNFANGTVNFYRNVGSTTSPKFAFVTDFYEGISIIGDSCLSLTTRAMQRNHGAGAFRFADIDGDGTQDFFWGDLFSLGIFFLKNVGTPTLPDLECITSRYPPESPVVTGGFNMSSFQDIDGDTDLDLFVGLLGGIVQSNGFWFLENTGDSLNSNFVLRTKNYLPMIDVGMNAHPTLVDLDADLDLDMIIGNLNGELWFFQNIGTSKSPSFV
ncbi:MAG TPA: VCBS repeat-containing protein, partial [Bacteroidota bacterium]|nr:VCBS repeat-containing protein [Bacteroidota bacterium]